MPQSNTVERPEAGAETLTRAVGCSLDIPAVAVSSPGASPVFLGAVRDTLPTPPASETAGGATIRLLIETGFYSLDVTVAADVDLDDRFPAICNDTGGRLFINGWLIDSVERVPA